MNLRLGRLGQLIAPSYGYCLRCKTPWRFVDHHTTWYAPSSGCFPLCEKCWAKLQRPERRLAFYAQMVFGHWNKPSLWPDVRDAVLEGK